MPNRNANRPVEKIQSIDVNGLRNLFSKGRFATVVFKKKGDGSIRTLNGKTNVQRGLSGGGETYDAQSYGQLRVFDVNAKDSNGVRVGGYRTVTAQNVYEVRAKGKIYKVENVIPAVNFVQSVTFDSRSNVLRAVLDNVIYRYFNVPRKVFLDLIESTNKGKYFNEHIRNKFGYQRVN
jgi:hypothetical protein